MIFFVIIIIIFFGLYVFFFFKKTKFVLKSIYGIPSILLLLSLFFAFLGFFSYKIESTQKKVSVSCDVVFVLDVSKSMLALDYDDKSRLDLSKQFIKNYVTNSNFNRYSLVVFSGDATALIPLTRDINLFLTFLDTVDEKSMIKGGTNFAEALRISLMRFDDSKNGGAIIFLSDFEPNLEVQDADLFLNSLDDFVKLISEKNIMIFGVGFGSDKGTKIIDGVDIFGEYNYKKNNLGKDIITKFDNTFFNDFSNKLNAKKHKVNKIKDTENIYFYGIPSNDFESNIIIKKDISRYLLMVSFLFFLMYLILFCYFDKKGN